MYNIADLILGVRVSLSTSSNSLLFMRLLNFFFFFSLKEVLLEIFRNIYLSSRLQKFSMFSSDNFIVCFKSIIHFSLFLCTS